MEVVQQEDERMRRHVIKTTGGGECGATRGNVITRAN
jgi:hypothetical protein